MEHFVYAGNEEGCGLASLKMMLARIGQDGNYRYLEEETPLSLEGLRMLAEREGVKLSWKKTADKQGIRRAKSFPFILLFEEGSKCHAVYLYKRRRGRYFIFDPSLGPAVLGEEELFERWNGVFGEGERIEKRKSSAKRPRYFTKLGVFSVASSYLLSLGCFLASFFFFEGDKAVYWTISFLAVGAFFLFLERRFIVLEMRRFDRRFFPLIYERPAALRDFRSSFALYQEAKKNLFLNMRALVECPPTCLSVLFLFGFNSPSFLAVGTFALLSDVILKAALMKAKAKDAAVLERNEGEFLKKASQRAEGVRLYESLLSKAEGFSLKEELARILTFLSLALLAFLPPLFEGRIEINYYLFGFFGLCALLESFSPALESAFDEGKKKRMCYFAHLFRP